MIQIQDNISEQKNLKDKLESEQEKLHVEYNKVSNTTQRMCRFGCMTFDIVLKLADSKKRMCFSKYFAWLSFRCIIFSYLYFEEGFDLVSLLYLKSVKSVKYI